MVELGMMEWITGVMFVMGVGGIMLNRKNIIKVLMSIELVLLAVNVNMVIYSVYLDDMMGQLFALFILTVAAAESAVGLGILVAYYRVRGSIGMERVNLMHG
uniref:NADH dehydrogenase subunit 4L n=1 Tax=Labyrinthula sp. TaxID=1678526 RepID=A0A7S6U9R3_9STRA|nr:NADH dehydrogenase subunit 4L [Labyrinthula sp.]